MRKQALISVAALIASASLAIAQEAPSAARDGSKNMAPAEKMETPSAADKAPGQVKEPGSSAKQMAPGQMKEPKESAKELAPGQSKKSDVSVQEGASGNKKRNADDAGGKSGDTEKNADKKSESGSGASEGSSGKAAATDKEGGSIANVPAEKKTQVRAAFTNHRVEPAKNINISVNVGVNVPRSVRLYSVPEDVIVIYPAYRRYRYFLIDDRICIVDPETYEIVDVIEIS